LESDPSFLLSQWQDSVVALWTPTTRASGFVIDSRGLIATNQRVLGTATSVEVQLTPAVKVAASVLAADPVRDVAVLQVDAKSIASVRPVPMPCRQPETTPLVEGEEIFTIGVGTSQQGRMTSATASRMDQHGIVADFILARGDAGGPVFTASGDLLGITSIVDEDDRRRQGDSRVVRIDGACDVVASAETTMAKAAPPSGTHLPIEPVQPFPPGALKESAERRPGSLEPYQISSSSFDVAFITPVLTYAAQSQAEQPRRRTTSMDTRSPDAEPGLVRPDLALRDFSNWSDYVAEFPPVRTSPLIERRSRTERCERRSHWPGPDPILDTGVSYGTFAAWMLPGRSPSRSLKICWKKHNGPSDVGVDALDQQEALPTEAVLPAPARGFLRRRVVSSLDAPRGEDLLARFRHRERSRAAPRRRAPA
jgi:hypothetical protein